MKLELPANNVNVDNYWIEHDLEKKSSGMRHEIDEVATPNPNF